MTAVEVDLEQVVGLIRLAVARQLVRVAKLVVVVVWPMPLLLHLESV